MARKYITESSQSARKRYLQTDLISARIFNFLQAVDPSKNKKYLEWMCKVYLQGAPEEEIEEAILKYYNLIQKKAPLRTSDIYNYSTLDELNQDLDNFEDYESRRYEKNQSRQEGARLLYENEKCNIYLITTREACKLYGAHTKWCITSNKEDDITWELSISKGFFLFIISKHTSKKYAVFYAFPWVKQNYKEVWDDTNTYVERLTPILEYFDIDIPEYDRIVAQLFSEF